MPHLCGVLAAHHDMRFISVCVLAYYVIVNIGHYTPQIRLFTLCICDRSLWHLTLHSVIEQLGI